MKNLRVAKAFSVFVLIAMIAVTTWASLEKSVIIGFEQLFAERWGIATLFDAYFGFLFFYVWVYYRENSGIVRAGWLVAILCFGNIAMAIYVLNAIRQLPENAGMAALLAKRS